MVTSGSRSSRAVSACTAVRVLAAPAGGPLISTRALGPMVAALVMMASPRTDSDPEPPLVSFSRENTWLPITIPPTNSTTQASRIHRRLRTQKRATDAYMSPSPGKVLVDVRVTAPNQGRASIRIHGLDHAG